jgi:hypothetical protein
MLHLRTVSTAQIIHHRIKQKAYNELGVKEELKGEIRRLFGGLPTDHRIT